MVFSSSLVTVLGILVISVVQMTPCPRLDLQGYDSLINNLFPSMLLQVWHADVFSSSHTLLTSEIFSLGHLDGSVG